MKSNIKWDKNDIMQSWGIVVENYLGSVWLVISIGSFHINIFLWDKLNKNF